MPSIHSDQLKRIGLHSLFWVCITLIFYNSLRGLNIEEHFWLLTVWLLPIDLFAVYFSAYYLIPQFLLKRKYKRFILFFLLSSAVFVLLERLIYYYRFYPVAYPALRQPFLFFPELWHLFITINSFVFLFSGLRIYQSWARERQRQMELEKQNLGSELAMLKSQINPHFLFNTLNNIDLLVFKDPQKASDSIVKLSEIMRYMLYETNSESVALSREIHYLEGMVDLMRLRLKNPDVIEFTIEGNPSGKTIPPMLLAPFVENAFKHGKKSGQKPSIFITLEITDEYCRFETVNRIEKTNLEHRDGVGGIGLPNVKRRLDLIYGNQYELAIQHDEDWYQIKLKIPWWISTQAQVEKTETVQKNLLSWIF